MPIDDGGPAFARAGYAYQDEEGGRLQLACDEQNGMTLRDYFASEAPLSELAFADAYRHCLEKHLEGDDLLEAMADYVACWKFEVADAMLRYRKAGA